MLIGGQRYGSYGSDGLVFEAERVGHQGVLEVSPALVI